MNDSEEYFPAIELQIATAEGFLKLGQPLAALEMLQEESPEVGSHVETDALRLRIHIGLEQWESAVKVALSLWRREPNNVEWYRAWAKAIQYFEPSDASAETLREMLRSGIVDYSAALSACADNDLSEAEDHLQIAFALNPSLRPKAQRDSRLRKVLM